MTMNQRMAPNEWKQVNEITTEVIQLGAQPKLQVYRSSFVIFYTSANQLPKYCGTYAPPPPPRAAWTTLIFGQGEGLLDRQLKVNSAAAWRCCLVLPPARSRRPQVHPNGSPRPSTTALHNPSQSSSTSTTTAAEPSGHHDVDLETA